MTDYEKIKEYKQDLGVVLGQMLDIKEANKLGGMDNIALFGAYEFEIIDNLRRIIAHAAEKMERLKDTVTVA